MSTFDILYFSVFKHYKSRFKQKANTIAIAYVSLLQIALIMLLGVFIAEFLEQMHTKTISSSKAWTLFYIASTVIYFRNWMVYSGKKRNVLNAKATRSKITEYNIWVLWFLLLGCFVLAIIIALYS